jgi:type IV secretory pathway TraG/TraD family ATPase VirD4
MFPSIGIVLWLGSLSCWIATQSVAASFGYQPALGEAMAGHIYDPFEIVKWAVMFDHPAHLTPTAHKVFLRAYLILKCGNAFSVLVAFAFAVIRVSRLQRRTDLYGSAHWASPREVDATGLIHGDGGVYAGAWLDPKSRRRKYLRVAGSSHCLGNSHLSIWTTSTRAC